MKACSAFTLFLLLWAASLHMMNHVWGAPPPTSWVPGNPPRVAVFAQPEFPFYNVSSLVSPQVVAANLRAAGVTTDVLDAAALADPARLQAGTYAAVVLPYGNTYPQAAFANLRAFHRAGGSLILSGVPFTHPVARLSARHWTAHPDWGTAARSVAEAHAGQAAIELTGPSSDWVGVASERHPVQPGARVTVTAWTQSVRGPDRGDDWVYIRFFNAGGDYITQDGVKITPGMEWRRITATVTAPRGAATFDIAPQIRSPRRVVRLDDLSVSVAGRPVMLANAGFETPGSDWTDLGHHDGAASFGPGGIGVGGFADKPQAPVKVSPGDPLGLKALGRDWPQDSDLQAIDVASLPAGVEVKPILLEGDQPVAALLIHRDGAFKGAVDAWTNHPDTDDLNAYHSEQIMARAAIAALTEKGLLSPAQKKKAFATLTRLPRPKVYAKLKLPSPPRPYPTFNPKMPPPARHLHAADVRTLPHDQRVLLVSLQGIVNRTQPRIYLIFGGDDRFWLDQLQKQGQTDAPVQVADPLSLVETFRASIQGAVVADPNVYISPNIAASIAGLDDLVVATPELAARLKLPIRRDLRGQFNDNAGALRYARTTLLRRLNPYLTICLDPPLLGNGAMDQIIAAKGLAFWITGPKQQNKPGADTRAELEEIKELFASLPLNATVRGFWWHGHGQGMDESFGVALGSRFGKVTVVSDHSPNLSVFSGVPKASLRQKPQAPPPPLDRTKVYIAFTMSDGDNLSTWRGYFRGYFEDPLQGTIPMGWGMAPGLLEVAPTLAQWYYDQATPNDEFICDVSGVGYIYPPDWATALRDRDAAFRAFYDWTARSMERMDMRTIRLMNVRTEDIPRVGRLLPTVPFLMPDYGWSGPQSYEEFTYTLPTGQPVFRAALEGQGQSPQEKAERLRRRAGTARPAFLNAFVWNWGSKLRDLKQMLDILGPEYVAVTPSQLDALYRMEVARGTRGKTRKEQGETRTGRQ
jgi:putative glycoside hydrolase with GxGYxYP motif/GxGYxY motif-containing protein